MDDPADREKAEGCEGTVIFRSSVFSDNTASPASPAESRPEIHQNDRETKSNLNKSTTKSRVKSSSRRLFLDDSLSGEEEADDTDKAPSEGVPNVYSDANWSGQESDGADNRGSEWVVSDQDSSLIPLSTPCENSWTCPIALDELSPSSSDTETEASSSPRPVSWLQGITKSPVGSNNSSGVILKLRRIFSKGLDRKKARYQANCDSGTFADPSLSQTDDREGEMVSEMDLQRRTPKVTHRWQRTGRFTHTLRPLSGNSKRKRRSLLKIKYCPYLSACHSAEHRRRWVLRSAVQRAQRAMRFFYPDLVGKKIRHLYEEDDKSEVWYRGEVLRIHEANANPLKTLFEVRYDSEPEWKYYLELLIDYKKGWLKIED